MDKRRSAVFGRLFSFVGILLIFAVCIAFVCACDMNEVSSLFTPNDDFQVTFVLNNGEENIVWHTGDVVPSPTKEGYKLVGWCNDVTLTSLTSLDFDSLNLSQSIVLYAKWEELPDIVGVYFSDVEVVYDGLEHALEVANLPSGATVKYDTQTSYVNVGEYTVNALVSLEGYKDLSLSATLTIKKASVSGISFASKSVDWDGEKHSIEIVGDLPSEVSVEYIGNGQSEVGKHEVIARFLVSDNYEPIEDMRATLTINEVYFLVSFVNGNGNIYTESVAHGCDVRQIPKLYEKDGYTASWQSVNTTSVYKDLTINAVYTPIAYTISFVSVDDVVKEVEYNIEKSVNFSDWQREHYTFDGWYANRACTGKRIYSISKGSVGDKTYYAKWVPIEYTVKYHLNGGINNKQNTNSGENYVFTVESLRFTLSDPSRLHYEFEGWYANADFTGMRWYYLPKGASGNREFYAKWTPEKYSIEYRLGGGVNHEDNPSEYNYESSAITLLPATREHYEFVCWRDETNEVVTSIADGIYDNIVLIAEWKAVEHTVYLCDEDEAVLNKITYTIESDDITFKDELKEYCDFVGWFDSDGNKITTISSNSAKDIYVYAKFEPKKYEIKYALNGGINIDNPTIYTVESEDIVLKNPHRDYYNFLGWFNGEEKIETIAKGSHGNIILQARWQAVEYFIEYNGVEDISDYVTSYTVESESIILPTPNKNFYTFDGWYTSEDFEGDAIEEIVASNPQNIRLYAKFTAIEYQIYYNLNGGVNADNPTTYTVESEDIFLNNPVRNYYEFCGWFCDEERVEVIACGSHGDIELNARWQAIVYDIKYHGVEDVCDFPTSYIVEDENIVLPILSKEYYSFQGWFLNEEFIGESIAQIDTKHPQNINLYAKFTAIEYHISYELNGGADVDNPTVYTIEDGDITLKNPTREHYDFLGWYEGENKVDIVNVKTYGNITLSAKWIAIQHIIYLCDEQGNTLKKQTYTIESGDITLEDVHKDYYDFVGWFDKSGKEIKIVPCTSGENVYVYAKFTPIEYQIEYNYNGGKQVDNPTKYTVESEDILLLPTARDGYTFIGWYNGDNRVERIPSGSHGDITLDAKWSSDAYSITYHNVQDSSNYPSSYSLEGGDVALPIPQKNYYEFVGWYENEDFSGESISLIKADSKKDYVLYARFSPIVYNLNYEYNGGLDAQNPSTYTVESKTIVLDGTSKKHYNFLGWYVDGIKVERIEKGSHGDITLSAIFEPIKYTISYRNVENSADLIATYTVEDGEISLASPQKDYYNFDGWYLNADFSGDTITKLSADVNGSVSLYAKFSPIVYHIYYEDTKSIAHENPTSYTVEDDDFVLLDIQKDEFEFLGWYDKQTDEKVGIVDTSMARDITLVARWKEVEKLAVQSPFVVDNNGCLISINAELLDDKTCIIVPSSVNGVRVKSIASGVFASIADSVTNIEIAEGISDIASDLFEGMVKLEKLVLPSTIEVMHKGMLTDCVSLCDLTVPFASFCIDDENDITGTKYTKDVNGANSVGLMFLFGEPEDASNCKAISVYMGNNNQYCNTQHFYLPNTFKRITVLGGDICARTFYGINTLTSIILEDNVSYVGGLAFAKTSALKEIRIKGSDVAFATDTFVTCSDMTIYVANDSVRATVEELTQSLTKVVCSVII